MRSHLEAVVAKQLQPGSPAQVQQTYQLVGHINERVAYLTADPNSTLLPELLRKLMLLWSDVLPHVTGLSAAGEQSPSKLGHMGGVAAAAAAMYDTNTSVKKRRGYMVCSCNKYCHALPCSELHNMYSVSYTVNANVCFAAVQHVPLGRPWAAMLAGPNRSSTQVLNTSTVKAYSQHTSATQALFSSNQCAYRQVHPTAVLRLHAEGCRNLAGDLLVLLVCAAVETAAPETAATAAGLAVDPDWPLPAGKPHHLLACYSHYLEELQGQLQEVSDFADANHELNIERLCRFLLSRCGELGFRVEPKPLPVDSGWGGARGPPS